MFSSDTYLLPPGGCRPRQPRSNSLLHILSPLLLWPTGSGHPDPDFKVVRLSTTSNRAAAPPVAGRPLATGSTTASGRSTAVHRFARSGTASGSSRTERGELHPQQLSFLRLVFAACRAIPASARRSRPSGSRPRLAITMYAQLLTRSSTGAVSDRTPLLSCAIRFSWLQRSLAENTISSAGIAQSLVM